MPETVTGPPFRPSPPSASQTRHLDHTLAKGVAWTAAAKWSSQILSWASLIAIAHLLSPSDFGLVGMAALYLGLVTLFSEFGVGTAILTLRDLTAKQMAQLNSVSVLAGFVSFLLSCLAAVPLGHFFHAPKLPSVVVAMSTTFVVLSLRSVPYGLLQKEMQFRLLSVLETLQSMGQAVTALLLAFFGFGYWALVLGNVFGSFLLTVLTIFYKRHGFARPRFDSIRRALQFSGHVLVARLCWYGYTNADFLMAGRMLGASPLGEYTVAWNLATAPIEKISAVVVRVTPAFFSAVQQERAALGRYLRVLTEGLSILTFPATFGLALVADEFVPLALGRKWEGAIVPLQLLAFYASFRAIVTLLPQVLVVVGETRFAMWNSVATLLVMPTAFYIGSRWGTTGIATAWIVTYPLVVIPLYRRALAKIQLSVAEYMRGVLPPLNGSIVMAAAVFAVKWGLPAPWPLAVRLTLEVLAGAAAYVALMLGIYGARMRALWDLGCGLLKKQPVTHAE
jgi:O-antigen/teichoic acid export membrane protein